MRLLMIVHGRVERPRVLEMPESRDQEIAESRDQEIAESRDQVKLVRGTLLHYVYS